MELPINDVLKQGYIKFRGKSLGIWKKQWAVLKKQSSRGGRRLECYNDDKSASNIEKCEKTIELNDVTKIQTLPPDIKKHGVSIVFADKSARSFCCTSDREAERWMKAIEDLCLSRPVPAVNTGVDLLQSGPSQKEYTELFHVYLVQSPNLSIYGECLLQVTDEHIYVLDNSNPAKRLVSWPLNALRRYGSDTTKFTFESGRFCDTGEGIFIFNTTDGEAIYQKVHTSTVAIAEMHRILVKNDRTRAVSLPNSHSPVPRHVPAVRSQSSPSYPAGEAPIPPPRPRAALSHSEFAGSAVNSPLPPIPMQNLPDSQYLSPPDVESGPPLEQAPLPPSMVPYIRGSKGPDMYLNMMGQTQESEGEYYGHTPGYERSEETEASPQNPIYGHQYQNDGVFEDMTRFPPQPSESPKPSGRHYYVNQNVVDQSGRSDETVGVDEDYEPPEYLYAEKGLTAEFRKYLQERKKDS